MNVVLLFVRTRLRSSWRAALVLVVLVGLGGGVTLAVAAGARRTASANEAILRAANAPDAATSYADQHSDEVLSLLEDVPGIDALSILVGFAGRLEGTGRPASTLYFLGLRTDQPRVDRPFVLAGRLPTGPNEVLLNEGAAARTGLGLGDAATLALADPPDFIATGAAGRRAAIAAHQAGAEVVVIGKRQRLDAHTALASGGINAALGTRDPEDSWEQHFADTIPEGYLLSDPRVVPALDPALRVNLLCRLDQDGGIELRRRAVVPVPTALEPWLEAGRAERAGQLLE